LSGEVWGVEALGRWEHPERGLLDPSQFVPVAEETDLIGAFTFCGLYYLPAQIFGVGSRSPIIAS
jgi:sensor c-di-GMP phosphodiesterase-like protein